MGGSRWPARLMGAFMLLLLVLIVTALSGCGGAVAVVADVPVAVPCMAPPPLARPLLPISLLPELPGPGDTARAMAASLALCLGYAAELEAILDGYRVPPTQREPSNAGQH